VLAVPGEEGGLGDAELRGDASKAPALSAEFYEFVFGLSSVHFLGFLVLG